MLSAQKEDSRFKVDHSTPKAPMTNGFGTVLSSLDGLQQRLDQLAVEDISEATEKAKTLTLRLLELQRTVAQLKKIKDSIVAVRQSVDEAATAASKLFAGETQEPLAAFPATGQNSNLIRFPRIVRLAKEHARITERGAGLAEIGANVTEPAVVAVAPTTPEDNPSSRGAGAASVEDCTPSESHSSAEPSQTDTVAQTDSESSGSAATAEAECNDAVSVNEPLHDATERTASIAPTAVEFDQRLLNDLIKDYGEFTVSRDVAAPSNKPAETVARPKSQAKAVEPKSRQEAAAKSLTGAKKDGELDRQLKEIIKDYGENDLYRQQSPVNIKAGVLAGIVLLAVLGFGFYLFSGQKTDTPSHDLPTASSVSAGSDEERTPSAKSSGPIRSDGSGMPAPASAPNSR